MRITTQRAHWWLGPLCIAIALQSNSAEAEDRAMNVELIPQNASHWCWIASAQMIMHYYGIVGADKDLQCSLISGDVDGIAGMSAMHCCSYDCTGLGAAAAEFLIRNGVGARYYTEGLIPWSSGTSVESITGQINAGFPLIVCWEWISPDTTGPTHEIVVYGYYSDAEGAWAYVHDPMPVGEGDSWLYTYSFLDASNYDCVWTDPTNGMTYTFGAHVTYRTTYDIHHADGSH